MASAAPPRPSAPPEPVVVLVRPENVVLNPGTAAPGAIVWRGKVTDSIFRGPRLSLEVATPTGAIQVEATALCGIRVADAVEIAVAPEGAWAIRP